MGGKAAARCATIYCYAVEAAWVDAHVGSLAPNSTEANRRYIDDLFTLTGAVPPEACYSMTYGWSPGNGKEVAFLGMSLRFTPQGTELAILDKESVLGRNNQQQGGSRRSIPCRRALA